MASCRNPKYSQSELQRFNDRIQNILNHVTCRQELRMFLRQKKRFDLVKMIDKWELATYLKKLETYSPEYEGKFKVLIEMLKEDPDFNADGDIVTDAIERATRELDKMHRSFVDYINKMYRKM